MSGHSKWNNIKRTKEKADNVRGKVFTKIGREITVCVKTGGADPNTNSKLKDLITKAKQNNMPNDTINRCIKKASGENSNGNYEEIYYEGYGTCGSAVIVKCLTDNKNRTSSDLRHLFDKFGGSLGTTGCVSYLFQKKGVIVIEKSESVTEDKLFSDAIELDALDIVDDDDVFEVLTTPENYQKVNDGLINLGYTFVSSECELVPDTYLDLPEEKVSKFETMIENIEALDDVIELYHNVSLD